MKWLFTFLAVLMAVLVSLPNDVLAYCTGANILVIDPGHGGPAASQTNNGGGYNQGNGASGPNGTAEQWINLNVAYRLQDEFLYSPYYCVLTRTSDTQNVSYLARYSMARNLDACAFLSIHHNGLALGNQGTEVVWCGDQLDTNGDPRREDARDTSFAKKVLYKLLDRFEYTNRCSVMNQANPMAGCQDCSGDPIVVKNVYTAHVLSEASNINNATEEALFSSELSQHTLDEASALFEAFASYATGQGFGRIEYRYIGKSVNDQPSVLVDFREWGVPYERTWQVNDAHVIEALSFAKNGYTYSFHHWIEENYTHGFLIQDYPANPWYLSVNLSLDAYHYYVAYFKGGPFNFDILEPNQGITYLTPGTSQQIKWGAPGGVFDACSLKVAFSSNGGSTWQDVTTNPIHYHHNSPPLANQGYINWTVPSISAGNCRLRLIYWDFVGNRDTTISHSFAIGCALTQAKFVRETSPYYKWPAKIYFYDQSTNFPTSWLWNFGDGFTSTLQNPSHNYYAGDYTVSLRATNSCGFDDTIWTGCIHVAPCLETSPDGDHDGRGDGCDNCWAVYNPNQEDGNLDRIGDSCCCRGTTGNLTYDTQEQVDLTDLSLLIAFMTQTPRPILPCPGEANVNAAGTIDLTDISYIVAYLTVTPRPALPSCPHPYQSPPEDEFSEIRVE